MLFGKRPLQRRSFVKGQAETIHLQTNGSRSAVRMDAGPRPILRPPDEALSNGIEVHVAEGVVIFLHVPDGMIVIAGLPKRAVLACPVDASRRGHLERIHKPRQSITLRRKQQGVPVVGHEH